MSLRRRMTGAFALLAVLFLTLVFVQLVVGERQREDRALRADRVEQAADANRAVLQSMTDAETGVRGFQLTGDPAYLAPYEKGRRQAFVALDELAATIARTDRRLVDTQRQAAAHWLYAYGIPIVNAGASDDDAARTARGRGWFDDVRKANAAVDAAIDAEQRTVRQADRRAARQSELLVAALALLVLAIGVTIAVLNQRFLLRPLEHLRHTLRRLADGDLTARARPAGSAELRAVMSTLNDLAAETERLITAEQARAAVGELRQRVAAELRSERDPAECGRRVAALIGAALAADAVHGHAGDLRICWPDPAPPSSAPTASVAPDCADHLPGEIAVPLDGGDDCPPGELAVSRDGGAAWTEDDRRLLAGLGEEIGHAARQARLRSRQDRLITELRTLDAQKDVFVSTVTHELRTPLTSILGYTEMLTGGEGGDLSPMQQRSLTAIMRNAHRLQGTVADLMLLDRSNERLSREPEPVDLAAVLAAVHDELTVAARAKDQRCVLAAEPLWVRGDGAQLEHAARKLIENAIKFTPPGGRVELRLSADGPNAVLTVSDTGMGIPPGDMPGLFTPFHRAANAMDEAVQGPGLGLAIVRTIVTEHGGTVSARSELGRGSTFTVTLPAIAAVRCPAAPSTPGRA